MRPGTTASTDAEVSAGKSDGEDEEQVAIIDASATTNIAAGADVTVRHPMMRATK